MHEVEDGLDVWRTYSTPGYGRDLRSRLASYGTFAWWSTVAGARHGRTWWSSSPSLPSAAAAAALARARGAVPAGGARPVAGVGHRDGPDPRPPRHRRRTALEAFCERRADRIVAVTEGIREGLVEHGVPRSRSC